MNALQSLISGDNSNTKSSGNTSVQKRCKECGEYFTPRSMRQQYCDKLHYRPCPVCGKPVEAKYLSDPPRCCSKECQKLSRNKTQAQQKQEVVNMLETHEELTVSTQSASRTAKQLLALYLLGSVNKDISKIDISKQEDKIRKKFDVRTYIDIPILGFEPGHEYALFISKPKGYTTYQIQAVYDFDTSSKVDLMIPMSSQISINRAFSK